MKSHSSTNVTAGISRWARVTCSTIARRIPRIGTRRPSPDPAADARTSDSWIRPPGPVRVDADEVDAELSRQLPHGRRGPHGVDRLGRDDGDERLRRGVRAGVAPLDRAEQLLSLLADHDEHGPDGRDLRLPRRGS